MALMDAGQTLNINIDKGIKSHHVFLIDDDDLLRKSLAESLEFMGYSVHDFSDANQFLESSFHHAPAVVITDMSMPGISGVELQAALLDRGRNLPIIFISGDSSISQAITAFKQGAIEFLVKPFERQALVDAIERGIEVDAKQMHEYIRKRALKESLGRLSPREVEVFHLLSKGSNNSEIMRAMTISLPTAKQYKSEVMRKLGVRSLAELISVSEESS